MGSVTISFPENSGAESTQLAGELVDFLKERHLEGAEQVNNRKDTMDMGATVLLTILTTAAVKSLAEGIAVWLKRTGTRIKVGPDGTIIEGVDESKIEGILRAAAAAKQ